MKILLIKLFLVFVNYLLSESSPCVYISKLSLKLKPASEFTFAIIGTGKEITVLGPESVFFLKEATYIVSNEKPKGSIFFFFRNHNVLEKSVLKIEKFCPKIPIMNTFLSEQKKIEMINTEIKSKRVELEKLLKEFEKSDQLNFLVNLRILNNRFLILNQILNYRYEWLEEIKNEITNFVSKLDFPSRESLISEKHKELKALIFFFLRSINRSHLEAAKKARYILVDESGELPD